jgi:hypothetical protein
MKLNRRRIKTALQHIQSTSNDFHTANDILDDQVESEIHRGHTSIVIVYRDPNKTHWELKKILKRKEEDLMHLRLQAFC